MHNITRFLAFACLLLPLSLSAGRKYWVDGSGSWSDLNHWATTSGGVNSPLTLPTPNDTVYFDQNSFSGPGQVVEMDALLGYCKVMDWRNATNWPTFMLSQKLQVFGSVYLTPSMWFNSDGISGLAELDFVGSAQGNEIDFAGVVVDSTNPLGNMKFNINGTGSFDLRSDLVIERLGQGTFRQLNGVLRTNGHYMYCYDIGFGVSSPGFTDFGTSHIEFHILNLASAPAQFDAHAAEFKGNRAMPMILTCQELHLTGSSVVFSGNIGDTIVADTFRITFGSTCRFPVATVHDFFQVTDDVGEIAFSRLTLLGEMNIQTSINSPLTIGSSTVPIVNIIHRDNDTICLDHVWAGHVRTTGTAVWNLTLNCVDLGNNTGLHFGACGEVTGLATATPSDMQIYPTVLEPDQPLTLTLPEMRLLSECTSDKRPKC